MTCPTAHGLQAQSSTRTAGRRLQLLLPPVLPKHPPTTHKGTSWVGRRDRHRPSVGRTQQAARTSAIYPWSVFQIRRGSSAAGLGEGQAGWERRLPKASQAPHSPLPSLDSPKNPSLPGSAAAGRAPMGTKTRGKYTPLKINSSSKTLTIDQGKSETRKCFIGKVQKNQSLQLNLQQ